MFCLLVFKEIYNKLNNKVLGCFWGVGVLCRLATRLARGLQKFQGPVKKSRLAKTVATRTAPKHTSLEIQAVSVISWPDRVHMNMRAEIPGPGPEPIKSFTSRPGQLTLRIVSNSYIVLHAMATSLHLWRLCLWSCGGNNCWRGCYDLGQKWFCCTAGISSMRIVYPGQS